MSPEERIIQLERDLIETRNTAAEMITDAIRELVPSEAGRDVVARAFEDFGKAEGVGSIKARLARLIAAKIRERG
ncbi:hypothetical protein RA2_04003 [Roseovarius sp. A-2]|uniref:hypothetical protein n=1 Tax=Roseovarius sp. A-2 TaxID=1570360 RepID=UPI0009B55AFE|nr:hypothetical protein [Roseovarius sp. A-2]GAW36928.1 hypothetical protein RA2_04003 [Roseovarius sp. A-2]